MFVLPTHLHQAEPNHRIDLGISCGDDKLKTIATGRERVEAAPSAPSETVDGTPKKAKASAASARSIAVAKSPATPRQSTAVDPARARILLVEDLPMSQDLACAILRQAGHFVEIANDGIEAVAAAELNSYDVILMDIQMPRLDGVGAARKIRDLPGPAGQTPIVAMTANALPEQVRAFGQAGMDGYVAKPFQQQELLFAASSSLRLGARSSKRMPWPDRLRRMVRSLFRLRDDRDWGQDAGSETS